MMKISAYKKIAVVFLLSCAASANAATLLHNYQFQDTLNDSLGGTALIADGGTLGPSSYSFDINQGLTLSNGLTAGDSYSIALNFNFTTLSGWQKIVDFNDLIPDSGFYTYDNNLNFYPVTNGSTSLTVNTNADVVITRDSSTNVFTAYLNGVQELTFIDSSSLAVFNSTNNIIHFFEDDAATGYGESAPGVVNSIRIWDGALSANEVANISAVPVPGAIWLFGSGLGLLSFTRRKNKKTSLTRC